MFLLKKLGSELYIASNDNIIQCNINESSDQHVVIQKAEVPEDLKSSQKEVINKERNITSLEFSRSGKYIVVTTENKQIVVYDKHFKIIKNIYAIRAPSKACFTTSDDVVVADKTGDVYLYKLQDEKNQPTLLLGHLSVVLDLILTDCGKYIITSDRDEKIRVSHFPNSYNICSYCLGHTEFVSKIQIVKNILVSASGDGTVRFWNYLEGKQLGILDTNDDIEQKSILEDFSEQMSKEKVEVFALPITDMQLYLNNVLYIALSVYKYNCILLYSTDLANFRSQLVAKLNVESPFCFCLNQELIVFDNKFRKFKIDTENFTESNEPYLDKLYEKYKNMLTCSEDNAVTVLYKRKFDHVQEYLDRKKQRL